MSLHYTVLVNGKKYDVEVTEISPQRFEVIVNGKKAIIDVEMREERKISLTKEEKVVEGGGEVKVDMSGVIVKILANEGEKVERGEPIAILEAMKMENEVVSPKDGVVRKIFVNEGDKVQTGQVIALIE